ncbi:MAG: hypothetical protein JO044_04250 [Mycobacteriaceae bacterium]|nr:hypothetical protein [Mycobacteriaceae bacterium]
MTPLLEALARRAEVAEPGRARAVQRRWAQRPIAERAEVMLRPSRRRSLIERALPVGVPPWVRADRYARVMTRGLRALRRLPGVK